MKLASFIIKIACSGLGALGGLIMFFSGFEIHAMYAFMGLALMGICGFFVGCTLEKTDFAALFPPKAPRYIPQNNQSPSNTQGYDAQNFVNNQPQQNNAAPNNTNQAYAPDNTNQAYAPNQNYSFETPADPQ